MDEEKEAEFGRLLDKASEFDPNQVEKHDLMIAWGGEAELV